MGKHACGLMLVKSTRQMRMLLDESEHPGTRPRPVPARPPAQRPAPQDGRMAPVGRPASTPVQPSFGIFDESQHPRAPVGSVDPKHKGGQFVEKPTADTSVSAPAAATSSPRPFAPRSPGTSRGLRLTRPSGPAKQLDIFSIMDGEASPQPAAGKQQAQGGDEQGTWDLAKDGPKIIVAREEHTPQADTSVIPEDLSPHLYTLQKEGVGLAYKAMTGPDEAKRGFLLASGTGTGKTRQQLAVAEMFARQGKKVLIVTPNEVLGKPTPSNWRTGTFAGSFNKDSKAMGIELHLNGGDDLVPGEVHITTYDRLKNKDMHEGVDGDTVMLFDECHHLKNSYSANPSMKALVAWSAAQQAGAVLFASATPIDKLPQLAYLERIDFGNNWTLVDAMGAMGLYEGKPSADAPEWAPAPFRVKPHVTTRGAAERIGHLFDEITARGGMVKHELSMDGVNIEFRGLALSADQHQLLDDIEFFFTDEVDEKKDPNKSAGNANSFMHQRRQQEHMKIGQTLDAVKEELAAGNKVIVFVSRINDSDVGKWVTYYYPDGSKERVREPMHDRYGDPVETPGTAAALKDELAKLGIHDVAELHGNSEDKAAVAMAKFQGDDARVVIATIASGGTGIDLDDQVGDAPRSMIIVTPPFQAMENCQAIGRAWRANTKTFPNVRYILTDHWVDQRCGAIIADKMKLLGAAVSGETPKMDVKAPEFDEEEVAKEDYKGALGKLQRLPNNSYSYKHDLDGFTRIWTNVDETSGQPRWMVRLRDPYGHKGPYKHGFMSIAFTDADIDSGMAKRLERMDFLRSTDQHVWIRSYEPVVWGALQQELGYHLVPRWQSEDDQDEDLDDEGDDRQVHENVRDDDVAPDHPYPVRMPAGDFAFEAKSYRVWKDGNVVKVKFGGDPANRVPSSVFSKVVKRLGRHGIGMRFNGDIPSDRHWSITNPTPGQWEDIREAMKLMGPMTPKVEKSLAGGLVLLKRNA